MSTYKAAGYFSGKPSGSKSSFEGILYKMKDQACVPTTFGHNQTLPKDLAKLKIEIQNKICDIEGNWLTHLTINKKQLWNVDTHVVTRPI